jgi:DNA-binding response OmpR family regulator
MTRILSLDGDPEMLLLLSLIFEENGYEHLVTTDRYEVWPILHTELVDLFILDDMGSSIDVWEFYKLMQSDEALHGIPVILSSARIANPDATIVKNSPFDVFIIKPFDISNLLVTVKKVLQKRGKPLPTPEEVAYIAALRNQPIEKRIAALQDNDPSKRRRAVWALRPQKHPQSVTAALVNMLDDENPWVRLSVVRQLAYFEDTEATEPLRKIAAKIPLNRIESQQAMKLPQVVPWNAEASVARWAKWAIGYIMAAQKRRH